MSESLRVIFVEDSHEDVLILLDQLRRGGYDPHYVRIETLTAMQEALSKEPWDIILADHAMPRFSGPQALQVLSDSSQDIPFIVVSGTVTEEQAIELMRAGAHDFVFKQNLARLVSVVQRELREAQNRRERREALEALRSNEIKYRTLFTLEPDALLLIDVETRHIVEANEAAQRLFGYTEEEFRKLTLLDLSAEPDKTTAAIAVAPMGETLTVHRRYRKNTGEIIPVEITARGFRLEGRDLAFASMRDVSERHRAQEALERERAFLSSAMELLPFPIIFNTPAGEVVRANQASYHFFEDLSTASWWKREFLTSDTREYIPPEEWPMMRAARGEVVTPTEGILVLHDGREVDVLGVAAPIYVNTKIVATVVAFMDITPIKEADRAKTRFLAVLSHELRTPLTNIMGWTDLALESQEIIPEALPVIRRSAQSQYRMLENLLEVSRWLHGKMELKPKPDDLWRIVMEVIEGQRTQAEVKRIELQVNPPPSPLPVRIDEKRMYEVFDNLLRNAINFTTPGGHIIVRGLLSTETVTVAIEDSGRGIPSSLIPRIFDLFMVAPEVAQSGGGLGLGLPLAKKLVEEHGGKIVAESDGVGKGSTFTVTLPRLEEAR